MVTVVARCFVQNRPAWQRSSLIPELEGEGYLALCRAARTYNPKLLPYPKAYFARAILNAMLKNIRRLTRTPGERVGLDVAEQEAAVYDQQDDLADAISGMDERDKAMAICRFIRKKRIADLAEEFQLNIRSASLASRRLARQIGRRLGIPDELLEQGYESPTVSTRRPSPGRCVSSPASSLSPASASNRSGGTTDRRQTCGPPAEPTPARSRKGHSGRPAPSPASPSRKDGSRRKAARACVDRRQSPGSAGRSSPAQTQRKKPAGGRTSGRRA